MSEYWFKNDRLKEMWVRLQKFPHAVWPAVDDTFLTQQEQLRDHFLSFQDQIFAPINLTHIFSFIAASVQLPADRGSTEQRRKQSKSCLLICILRFLSFNCFLLVQFWYHGFLFSDVGPAAAKLAVLIWRWIKWKKEKKKMGAWSSRR